MTDGHTVGDAAGGRRTESPFHAKGLVYQGARDFYAKRVPGGLDAVRRRLEPDLADFFGQSFLAGGWYDVLPIVPLSRTAAHLSGVTHPRLVRENAAWVAERDMNGVYRFALKLASPGAVVSRLPRLSMQYFDFGRAEGAATGDRRFETWRYGIPEALAQWMVWVTEGFTPVVLKAAGAGQVTVRVQEQERDGDVLGLHTVRMRFVMEWT